MIGQSQFFVWQKACASDKPDTHRYLVQSFTVRCCNEQTIEIAVARRRHLSTARFITAAKRSIQCGGGILYFAELPHFSGVGRISGSIKYILIASYCNNLIVLQNFESNVLCFANFEKYCNVHCKIWKKSQCILQKIHRYFKTYCKLQIYCNKYCKQ